ncbi:uncharacterized protein LOC123702635 [Colias croceus]|uniref:uncharacterized protein LOC123702635 n=1 Tax=Colias crocea TaxID=72248 RepID=UPI001E27A814|nr:uncharacterized protein LOC123702635 [Colias croceus]
MFIFVYLLVSQFFSIKSIDVATTIPNYVQNIISKTNITDIKNIINGSRRILNGDEVRNNRPYMVYLKLPSNNPRYKDFRRWVCGGVIIHEEYILTSAACIEDAKHFYVVSGTYRYSEEDDRISNPCIKNGAKKAVWKCVPRNYVFDGHENDNIRWMNNDIAIVKVEDDFDFNRRIRGCDFIPKPICYNNQSSRLEDPGTIASIAGWGSTKKYNDWVNQRSKSISQDLLQTDVIIVPKSRCKQRWGPRYHNIIDNYMICTKDNIPELSEPCLEKYADCTDIMYSGELGSGERRSNTNDSIIHSAFHGPDWRRRLAGSGGFCENDHGGPLVHGSGPNAVVIGVISACLVKERTNRCHGPFLYTSAFKNRVLINCAIYKDTKGDCSKLFRTSETHIEEEISWADHPDGPAKNEVAKSRRNKEDIQANGTYTTVGTQTNYNKLETVTPYDKVMQHGGVVLRASDRVFNETNLKQ